MNPLQKLWFYFTQPAAYYCKPMGSKHALRDLKTEPVWPNI